jgi:hypothetical protein
MRWARGNLPIVLLGAALLSCGAMLLALGSGTTFFQDTWGLVLDRQDFSARAFFMPHNEHIVVIPTAIDKLALLFGMETYLPERVVMTVAVLVAATLLFVYARRRLGPWPALIGAVLLLFLGPAWADMLWPFQIGFVGSALFGIAMLLALDRGDRRGDVAACVFLVLSLGFSSLGLPFVAAAAVDVLVRRRSHGLGRAWVAAVPAALYGAWWLGYGHEAETHVTLNNVLRSPQYALEGMASAVEALLGLNKSGPDAAVPPEWGLPILIALLLLVGYRQVRGLPVSQRFWPVAAAALASWMLAAFNTMPGREAYQNRYLYAGGVFILLLAVELLRDVRIGRRALLIAGAVALVAVSSNLVQFREGSRWLKDQAVLTRADLGAIEIARRTVDPGFTLAPEIAGTGSLAIVSAGKYLEAIGKHGSPAYSPAELVTAPAAGRRQADIVLSGALPLSTVTRPTGPSPDPSGSCVLFPGGAASDSLETPLTPGVTRIEVEAGPPAVLTLRRFAVGEFPAPVGDGPGETTTYLRIPRDLAPQPWQLHVDAEQPVRVCS